MAPGIQTPRGSIHLDNNNIAYLEFNSNFEDRFERQYTHAQKFLDSEILRLSEPFIPLLTGTLIKSGILGTFVGSGLVQWIAPYAAAQYYMVRKNPSTTGPLRGPEWFERMKQVHGRKLIEDTAIIAGGA